jgi:hypothetical protein
MLVKGHHVQLLVDTKKTAHFTEKVIDCYAKKNQANKLLAPKIRSQRTKFNAAVPKNGISKIYSH